MANKGYKLNNSNGNYAFGSAACSVTGAGDQVIAHGLAAVPARIKISSSYWQSGTQHGVCHGVYNGSTIAASYSGMGNGPTPVNVATPNNIIYLPAGSTTPPKATIAIDSTNITLTWTDGVAGAVFTWEAEI